MANGIMRVAVVGSGPAGVYGAEALAKAGVEIDVLDRLPAPYGLVRYGVAPDHLKIKSILQTLERVFADPQIRFVGNVGYGDDVTLDDLHECYDAVLFATGSPFDRRLGIPGEDLPGSHAAADLVNWYSGHPGADPRFALDAKSVAIVGAGNVALDVARLFAKGAAALAHTDMPDHVLAALDACPATDIHVVARRGPAQAKFTQVELREMGDLADADVVVDPDDLQLDEASREQMAEHRQIRSMVELFTTWSQRPPEGKARRVHFHFLRRPVALLGAGRVEALQVERCALDGAGNVTGTGELSTIPADLVVRSIGYRGAPLPGLPFDERSATIPNGAGRVSRGVYVAGWIKRGPTGVIGTNKADARESVASLLADDLPVAGHDRGELDRLLTARGVQFVTWDGWLRVDAGEIELGRAQGRERVKITELKRMLELADSSA